MSRVLLVSYPGYPSTPATLVANPWLGNTAAGLQAAGHAVLALDYGTLSIMRRLYPESLTAQLRPLAARVAQSGGGAMNEDQLRALRDISDLLDAHQRQTEAQLSREMAITARDWRPDVVAFELADTDGYAATLAAIRELRAELPTAHLVCGGRKAIWFRHRLLEVCAELDSVAYGDIEAVLPALATRQEKPGAAEPIAGLLERGQPPYDGPAEYPLDLNDLPVPIYDPNVYPAMAGDEKIKMPIVTDSRGCPNRCAFCVHPFEDGGRLRQASPEKIADVFAALQARYGFSVFRLGGASTPSSLLHGLAQEILRRGLRLRYNSFGHFRGAKPDQMPTLAASGLVSLFFGLETGSQTILDRACHKGVKLTEVGPVVTAAREAGIFTATSMVVPLPFDTPETLAESLAFVVNLRPDAVPLQFPGLFPGSPWFENPERYAIEVADREQFLRWAMDYRIKLFFPPRYWEPLPYKVNGMGFHEFAEITTQFGRDLEAAGILTHFSHTLAALAEVAEMPPRQLRDLAQLWCLTGDAEAMGEMVKRANRNLVRQV